MKPWSSWQQFMPCLQNVIVKIEKFLEEMETTTLSFRVATVKNQRRPRLSFTERELIAYPITGNLPSMKISPENVGVRVITV